jgi:SAM-dependent methyltransferase
MEYTTIDNIKCYAPELAYANEDFPAEGFELLYHAEEGHFWFTSRNRVIQHLFAKFTGADRAAEVLEIGCGTGFVLKGLSEKFPKYRLQGSEIHLAGITFAQKRLPQVEFIQLDATRMPFENAFDAIGAFDVLEHIEQDETVMQQVGLALKSGGYFYISVPQYQWMWSVTDDVAYHKRRYHRAELRQKLARAGFEVLYMSSFVFTLFPFMALSRLLNQKKQSQASESKANSEIAINPLLNSIFKIAMKIDEWLIKDGISLPFGGSLIAVARKKV